MNGKYSLVLGLHLLTTAVILKIINYILPFLATWICSCVSIYFLWMLISAISFQFTKGKFLNEEVETENRAVFITGCDTGFGNGLAKRLDSKGFHVFASCLIPDGEGASKLKASCSGRLRTLPLDVRQDESVEKAVQYVKENLGSSELWAVVNNAGILKGFSVEMSTMDDFMDSLEVNFLGTVRVTKAFLPLLKMAKGRIVNVTSLGGELSLPFITPYLTSKYAAVGFTDCLRHEVTMHGVSVVSIEPEMFLTPLLSPDTINQNLNAKLLERVKEDRCDSYEETLKELTNVFISFACRNTSLVVDDLESAVLLLGFVSVVTSSIVPVAELFPPKPYKFGYAIKDKHGDGEQYREEAGDGLHDVRGSYGFVDDQGIKRLVKYVAGKEGFRAEVKTNEPGTAPMDTAGVKMLATPITVDAKETKSAKKESSLAQFEKAYKNMADVYKEALASSRKNFFRDAILANKMKEKEGEVEVEGSKTKLDLLELYKLGLLLPKVFEMYGTEKGLMTKTPTHGKLDYMKYLAPDEMLLLSLFSKAKSVPKKEPLLSKTPELTKLDDGAFNFASMGAKKKFSNFGKEAMLKDFGFTKG